MSICIGFMGICFVLDFVVVFDVYHLNFLDVGAFCAVWVMKGKKGKVYLRFIFL